MRTLLLSASFAAALSWLGAPATAAAEAVTYTVRQKVTLGPLEAGRKEQVDWWVSIPDDSPHQKVLDVSVVSAPGEWEIVRDPDAGNRFLYIDVRDSRATSLEAVVDFTLRREAVRNVIDPARVGEITDANRAFFADDLVLDAPHMEVTPEIRKLADAACGKESNVARQAELLLRGVARLADHYSKDPTKPSCGVGDAGSCIKLGGGCCTDLHSLFIAMARSRGIPARLQMGYRMLARNEGKWVDPGYRCWAEYFVPGYGWIPADIVEADAGKDSLDESWLTGLTVERLWLNQGRELMLPHDSTPIPVNHMSIGHAEINGMPVRVLPKGDLPPQLSRQVRFTRSLSNS